MLQLSPGQSLVPGDTKRVLGGAVFAQWWLLDHGQAVAYIQVMHRPHATDRPVMVLPTDAALTVCDIEVRPECRRRGYGRDLIAAIEAHYNATLHTTGAYTPLGYTAFARHLPLAPGSRATVSASFPDMTFVADWRACEPRYPL